MAINLTNTTPAAPSTTTQNVTWQEDASGNVSASYAFVFPNLTTTQKNALTPSNGQVVFDTTLAKLCVWTGSSWQTVTSV